MKKLESYLNAVKGDENLPYGNVKNESQADANDGTPVLAEQIQDIMYSLYQVLQLAGELPNGELEDGNNKKQFIGALCKSGLFKYSVTTQYMLGNIVIDYDAGELTVYRSLKNGNNAALSDKSSWQKLLTIDNKNKINFHVQTNISGGSGSSLPVFCFNSGPVDENGDAALITLSDGTLTQHSPAVCTTASGETYTVSEDVSLDISDLADGTYNLFYNPDTGGLEIYSNKIYIQKAEPSEMQVNDVWVDTSVMPYKSYKKISSSEKEIVEIVPNALVEKLSGSGGGVTLKVNNYNISPYVLLSEFESLIQDYDEYKQENSEFQTETTQKLGDLITRTQNYIKNIYINGQSGYIKLVDETIIQWGTNGYPGGAYTSFDVSFPTPFPQNSYTVVLTARGGDNINASAMKLLAWYTDHMTVKYTGAGNNSGTINGITWIAIGK